MPQDTVASSTSLSSIEDSEKQSTMQDVANKVDDHAITEPAIENQPEETAPTDTEKAPTTGPPAFDPSQFPDGGVKAWTVVVGGFCCLFCSFGWINCIGVFQDYYQTHMLSHLSPSTVSWIPSLEAFMMFSMGPLIGKWYDNYGPRYLLLVGSFLHVFGLMMTSLSTKYYQFILAQGICSPLGASMIFYSAMTSIITWFWHKRATALGIVAAGSSLGGVIFPIMTERLIPRVGFPWAMRIAAFLMLFLLVIANLTVRSRLPPHPKPLHYMEFIRPFREPAFSLLTLGMFLTFLGVFLPINFIILQATESGMSPHLAGYLVPVLNAASIFGRVIPGIVGDKIGRFNVMIILDFFSAIIVLALWIPSKSNAPIIVFAAAYGFGTGGLVSLAPSLMAQISDVRQIGVRNGSMFAVIAIAALIGNPIGGALLTHWHGKYTGLQIFTGVVIFAGSCCLVLTRWKVGGLSIVKKV